LRSGSAHGALELAFEEFEEAEVEEAGGMQH
jgi:hypothetical protein